MPIEDCDGKNIYLNLGPDMALTIGLGAPHIECFVRYGRGNGQTHSFGMIFFWANRNDKSPSLNTSPAPNSPKRWIKRLVMKKRKYPDISFLFAVVKKNNFFAVLSKTAINFQTRKIDMGDILTTQKGKKSHGNFHHTPQKKLRMANS